MAGYADRHLLPQEHIQPLFFHFRLYSFSSTFVFTKSLHVISVLSRKETPGLESKTRSSLLFLKKSPHLRCRVVFLQKTLFSHAPP